MNKNTNKYCDKAMLDSIVIFRNIFKTQTMQSFYKLVCCDNNDEVIKLYTEFVSNVYRHGGDFSKFVRKLVYEDSNPYITSVAQNLPVTEKMEKALAWELSLLDRIAAFSSDIYTSDFVREDIVLPEWDNSPTDFLNEYRERVKNVRKYGYGIYSKYFMFIIREGCILPVKYPDEIKLSDLIGYERQRNVIKDNTLALIKGKPALNILLTGDSGTGKSSTVKAVANEYRDMGLRIIEVRKDQLCDIPMIIEELSRDPLKFIIFIDDLSFGSSDENFGTLKAILEGSVSARANNIVIYATSNRRHLVRERFSDRDGDDIHPNDTTEELISLSERFGLHVTFSKPDKREYFEIVRSLAKQHDIEISDTELGLRAERFAMEKCGRSARSAKQLIDKLLSEKN